MYIDWLLVNKINFILKLKKAKSIMLLAFGLLLHPSHSFSQMNFVPNSSFETLDSCVSGSSGLALASPWNGVFKSGGGCWAFLCNACFTYSTGMSVPKNINGGGGCFSTIGSYQLARTGNGYAYLSYFVQNSTTPSSFRRYAQAPLTTTLTLGKEYCVTYYASLSNRAHVAVDELGAYLDDGSITTVSACAEAIVSPQIKSPNGIYMMDTLNWMKVQGTFISNGTECYITLGNFRSTASTNYTLLCSPNGVSEYYVDDVSVIELDLSASAGPDKNIFLGDSTFIGQPPEIGLECTWYNGTVAIGTGAGIWVKPTATTAYVVQQDICGVIKTDTVTVTVQYVGIDELNKISLHSKLYPNPNSGEFNIEITGKQRGNAEVSILDVTGKTVYVKIITETGNLKPELENGIYMVKVKLQDGTNDVHRLVISK
jgi:hypothetical protein